MEGLEAPHWAGDPFEEAIVLFNYVADMEQRDRQYFSVLANTATPRRPVRTTSRHGIRCILVANGPQEIQRPNPLTIFARMLLSIFEPNLCLEQQKMYFALLRKAYDKPIVLILTTRPKWMTKPTRSADYSRKVYIRRIMRN